MLQQMLKEKHISGIICCDNCLSRHKPGNHHRFQQISNRKSIKLCGPEGIFTEPALVTIKCAVYNKESRVDEGILLLGGMW